MTIHKKLFDLLDNKSKKEFFWFLLISVIYSGFETAGLAFILPYLDIVQNFDSGIKGSSIAPIFKYLNLPEKGIELVYFASLVLLILMTTKYTLQLYVSYLSAELPYNLFKIHGGLLAKRYNNMSWVEFAKKNTNEMIKNVTKSNEMLAYSYVIYLQYLTSAIVIIFLTGILFFVDYKTTFILLIVFGSMAASTHIAMRGRQKDAGLQREKGLSDVYKKSSELFLSNREIKITKTKGYFLKQFLSSLKQLSRAFKTATFFPRIPVVIFEMGAIMLLIFIVIVNIHLNYNLTELVAILIFYAAVGRRLLPSISTLVFCQSTMKNLEATIDIMHEELDGVLSEEADSNQAEDINLKKLNWKKEITIDDLWFSYNKDKPILKGVSFKIKKNTSIAFVGESGAGKSTIIDILTGLITADSGNFKIDGKKIESLKLLSNIGYVPQMPTILDSSIEANIAFGQEIVDDEKLEKSLKLAHLKSLVGSLDEGLQTIIGERGIKLSGGQRQRISIARALYHDPEIIFFDEATSALDNISEKIINDTISELSGSKTIIAIAHRLSTIRHFDLIYVVKEGKIISSGRHDELLENCHDYIKMNSVVGIE